jgi:hypothetical protein
VAKTKTTTVKEIIPDDGMGIDAGDFAGIDDDLILSKIHEDYPDSQVKQKVYRGGVFQFSTTEIIDEEMCQQYGGGKYEIRFIVAGKTIHKIYMEVAEPVRKPNGAVSDATTVQNQMLRDQLQWNQQMILTLLGKPGPAAGPQTPMQDLVMAWNVINGSAAKVADPTALIIKGIELADKITGKGEGGDWKIELMRTLREVAPAVTGAMMQNQNPNGNGATEMLPAATAITASDQKLKMGLQWLKSRIIAGFPVGFALDWLVANANDPTYQPFIAMALQKSFEDVVRIDPEFANEPYNTWTRQMMDGIKEWNKQANSSENDEEENNAAGA